MDPKRILLITILSVIILVQQILGANIYVSPQGNDQTGNGSESNPYQTIGKAGSVSAPYDTIILMPGEYNNIEAEISNPITLTSQNGLGTSILTDQVIYFDASTNITDLVIEGGGGSTSFSRDNSLIQVDNCIFNGVAFGLDVAGLGSTVIVTNTVFQNTEFVDIAGGYYITVVNSTFTNGGAAAFPATIGTLNVTSCLFSGYPFGILEGTIVETFVFADSVLENVVFTAIEITGSSALNFTVSNSIFNLSETIIQADYLINSLTITNSTFVGQGDLNYGIAITGIFNNLLIESSSFTNFSASAIIIPQQQNNEGTMLIKDTLFANNTNDNDFDIGTCITLSNSNNLTVENSKFLDSAEQHSAAIMITNSSSVTLVNSVFQDTTSNDEGSALSCLLLDGSVTIVNCQFTNVQEQNSDSLCKVQS